jgi:predicted transcriptional regulator
MSKYSYKAFLNQIETGKKETDSTRIYNFIKSQNNFTVKPNLLFVAESLKMKHQTVTARLSELMDLGVIETTNNKEKDNYSFFQTQTDPEKIKQNAINRSADKFKKWVAKGKYFDMSKQQMIDIIRNEY